MKVDERVRDQLRVHADRVRVEMPPAERILERSGRRAVRTSVALVAGVSVVVVAAAMLGWPSPTLDVADSPGSAGVQVIQPELLDGTRLRLALPNDVMTGVGRSEWAGSLYAAESFDQIDSTTIGWRLEVRRGAIDEVLPAGRDLAVPLAGHADAARVELDTDTRLALAFGHWVAVISGDQLTDEHVDLLIEQVDLAETPSGDVRYVGSLPLWTVDAPDLLMSGATVRVSVFLRSCSATPTRRTNSGLDVSRVDDPNRGSQLAVLCSNDLAIEIWIETPQPIDDTSLDQVGIDVITAGSTLTALNTGQPPFSDGEACPNTEAPVYDGVPAGWQPLPPPPLFRQGAAVVWTGDQLLYVGGNSFGEAGQNSVAVYDTATGTWSCRMAAPFAVEGTHVAWTGQLIYAWGGSAAATYDPATGAWRQLRQPPSSAPTDPVVVSWTGRELIVWGSRSRPAGDATGVAYDPNAELWRQLPDAPIMINQGQGVWTGSELIIFGSQLDGNNRSTTSSAVGAAYNPDIDRWRQLPQSTLSPQASSIAWTGEELIAWDYELSARAYDPATDTWSSLPDLPLQFFECYPDVALLNSGTVFAWFCGQAAMLSVADRSWIELETPITTHWGRPAADNEVDQITGPPTVAGNTIYFAGRDGLWHWTPPLSD